jgi:hypothetical protein
MDSSVVTGFHLGFITVWGKTLLFAPRPSRLQAPLSGAYYLVPTCMKNAFTTTYFFAKVCNEKLTVAQLLGKIPVFYGTVYK